VLEALSGIARRRQDARDGTGSGRTRRHRVKTHATAPGQDARDGTSRQPLLEARPG